MTALNPQRRFAGRLASRHRAALLLVAAMLPSPALAQTEREKLEALPAIEQNGFNLRAAVQATYDSNIFRTNDDVAQRVDDIIVTPTVEARFNRTIGPNSLNLSALAGYDRFVSNGERSKPRFVGRIGGKIAVLNPCTVSPKASYRAERANYGDLNGAVENQQRFSELGIAVSCERPAGIYPKASYLRTTTRNEDAFDFADQTSNIYAASLSFAKPSFGVLQLAVQREEARRDTLGYTNRVDRAGVIFDRAISSRLSAHIDVHALRVRPTVPTIQKHDGVGWDVSATTRLLSPMVITLGSRRTVVNDSLITTGYVLQNAYTARLRLPLSSLTEIEGNVERRDRRFRHETITNRSPIDSDRVWAAELTLRRKLTERFKLVGGAGYYNRSTDDALVGSYKAFTVTLGAEAVF